MSNLWRKASSPNILRFFIKSITLEKVSYSSLRVSRSVDASAALKHQNFSKLLLVRQIEVRQARSKSKKAKDDEEEENYIEDTSLNKDSKVVKFNTTSMRTDLILKTALGIARNKIEQQFYESKIRLNGRKIMKKSTSVTVGDEIDLIKMVSPKNSDHIYVARVEVLNAAANDDSITITVRRFKNLLIENYETDPYKGGSSDLA